MASKIVLKKSSVPSKVPVAGDLDFGELAINYADGKLYFKRSDGTTIDYFSTGSSSGPSFSVSETPPVYPKVGDQWINSNTGIKYTYLNDGDSSQWVEVETNVNIVNGTAFSGSYLDLTDKPTIPSDISQLTDNTNLLSSSSGITLTGSTTNSTETELFIDGSPGSRILVPTNKMFAYTVDIACRRTDVQVDNGYWYLKGAVSNISGFVNDVGNLYEMVVVRTDATFAVDVRADDVNNTLNVYVTGNNSKTIEWKAVVTVLEI